MTEKVTFLSYLTKLFSWALQKQHGSLCSQTNVMRLMGFTCQLLYLKMWSRYHRMTCYCFPKNRYCVELVQVLYVLLFGIVVLTILVNFIGFNGPLVVLFNLTGY